MQYIPLRKELLDIIQVQVAEASGTLTEFGDGVTSDISFQENMIGSGLVRFHPHVLHLIKTSDEPFYCFLSGGAGVGKSHLTKAMYQAALKYYNTRAGVDFAEIKVLILD